MYEGSTKAYYFVIFIVLVGYSLASISMNLVKTYLNNKATQYYSNQLWKALHTNDTIKVQKALSKGAQLTLQGMHTPLTWAYLNKEYTMLKLLLTHTALHTDQQSILYSSLTSIFKDALETANSQVIELFLTALPSLVQTTKEFSFHWLTQKHNPGNYSKSIEKIAELLVQHGVSPDSQNYSGNTPLHHAAEQLNIHLINCLLKYKVNPCIKNQKGECAYQTAANAPAFDMEKKNKELHEYYFSKLEESSDFIQKTWPLNTASIKNHIVSLLLDYRAQNHQAACTALARLLALQPLIVINAQDQLKTITVPLDIAQAISNYVFT
ncbi:ankyrin repeat domain-containing protein [Candidatus Dependentiae bacterium]|nr:ankyrin repeat domain-containing protein [Candidatus Dependentiae bacterium]